MAEPDSIPRRILEIVAEEMGVDASELSEETRFDEDLGVDDFGFCMSVIYQWIEDDTDVYVSHDDEARIRTIGDLIEFVKRAKGIVEEKERTT
jgi:acyl carrier protein